MMPDSQQQQQTNWLTYALLAAVIFLGWQVYHKPAPVDPNVPTPAPVVVDTELVDGAESAIRQYVQTMADNMRAAAKSTDVTTVDELSVVTVALDEAAGDAFKEAMRPLLEPRLGNSELPKDYPTILNNVADGFEKVAK